jgi:peptidyl-prolyl cis-trans isomerase D
MLKFLSKRKRSRNLLLYFFVLLLTVGLIGFFSVAVSGEHGWFSGATSDDKPVAKVVGYDITVKDLNNQLKAFGQQMSSGGPSSGMDPASLYGIYGTQVMDGLIRQKIEQYEADQIGLMATDDEVTDRIRQYFSPWPGYDQYRSRITQNGMTVTQFEDDLRTQISEEKLRSYVSAAAVVSPAEVEDDYRKTNTTYDIRWVEVRPDQLKDKVQVADADAEAYFNAHKGDFRINDEQRRAKYIFIDQSKAGETIQVSDDELKKGFDPERGVKQVRVSEIVLNIPKTKPDAAAPGATPGGGAATNKGDEATKAKADSIVGKARETGGKPGEDFAKLAKENSDDSKTKANGGDLGWVNKDDKREPDDPLSRVFTMKKGEVSPPIKKGDSYYILKVIERKQPTFEESREQLLKESRAQKGYSKAVDISTEAEKKFKESKNADAVVADLNKTYAGDVASVKETPYFVQGDSLPDIGPASELESGVFQLPAPGDVGDHQNVNGGFAIPQYEDKKDPHDAAFAEVKQKVYEKYRLDKAKDLALEKAKELAKAKTPDELKSLADSMGLKPDERPGVTGNDSIGPLMTDVGKAPVYKLNPGEVTSEPIKVEDSDNWVVVGMMKRKDPDMAAGFEKDRKSIEDRLLQAKREMLFSSFLESTEKRLKDEGKIKIYDKVIEAALASEAGAPQVPGMPQVPGRQRPRRTAPNPPRR